jgi:hypothetical protein
MYKIRYKKTKKEGIWVSCRIFTSETTKAQYKIFLDENVNNYWIYNINSRVKYFGEKEGLCWRFVKTKARERLESLGVKLEKEQRDINYERINKMLRR